LKVLHISTGFPLSFPGGITNYARTLVESQVKLGYQVHVVARPEPAEKHLPAITLHPYVPSNVTLFSLQNTYIDPAEKALCDLIRRQNFDLVHFHMSMDLSLSFLQNFSELGVPYLVSLHDYFHICPRITMIDVHHNVCRKIDIQRCNRCIGRLDQVDLLRRAARKLDFVLPRIPSDAAEERMGYMRQFLNGASVLHAVSSRTGEIFREVVPEAKIIVEQIGNSSTNSSIAKVPSDKLRVVALSTLSKHKGAGLLEILLKRVRRKDIEFHFYGRTFEGYESRLRALGLHCHGSYVPADIPSIMAASDIGLVLSIWEDNGPQVAMEFINHRVPVIGTKRGGIPDIVSPASGFLFDPDSPDEIDRVINWVENVTFEDLTRISSTIHPLKTPDEHSAAIAVIYEEVLKSHSLNAR
jgi:glycosyltransferase involved in cell wall biosynthesis